ncbi:MAG: anti-sigma factor antagonist [Actinophytocola sp.]|nr:anti-sigma factor antagonist [Actinophytocola sp.]
MTRVVEQSNDPQVNALLQVSTDEEPNAVIVEVAGEVDMLTAPRFERELERAIARSPQRLVVDLTDVTFLSSAGLALLVRARKDCADTIDMRIVAAGSATLRPIELMGLEGDLRLHSNRAEALGD